MSNRSLKKMSIASALAAIVLVTGSLAVAQIHKLGGPFFVSVLPAQPPTWNYTVTSDSQNEVTSVVIHSASNLSDCTITAERLGFVVSARQADTGHEVVLETRGSREFNASIHCPDHEQGEVYLKVTDAGGITRTIGPIAGPK